MCTPVLTQGDNSSVVYLGIPVKIEVSFLSLLTLFKSQEYRKSHMIPPPKRFSGVHTQPPPFPTPPPPPLPSRLAQGLDATNST